MIKTRTELRDWLDYERRKYGIRGGVGTIIYLAKLAAGSEDAILWRFQRRLRITEYHLNAGHRLRHVISHILLNRLRNRYGLFISPNVFGRGLRIRHLGHILTNGGTRAGRDCTLHVNTAMVAQGTTADSPRLGDNIVLGVGSTIVGGVTLADGIAVGAGAVVTKSFLEKDIAIAGVPARKISDNGRSHWAGQKNNNQIKNEQSCTSIQRK